MEKTLTQTGVQIMEKILDDLLDFEREHGLLCPVRGVISTGALARILADFPFYKHQFGSLRNPDPGTWVNLHETRFDVYLSDTVYWRLHKL